MQPMDPILNLHSMLLSEDTQDISQQNDWIVWNLNSKKKKVKHEQI